MLRTAIGTMPFGRAGLAFLHDVAMAAVSFPLSLELRLGSEEFGFAAEFLRTGLPIFILVAAGVFLALGLYRGVWRYASMADLLAIVRAVSLTVLVFLPIMFLVSRLAGMPRSVLLINWFVLIFLLGTPRFLYRIAKDGGLAHVLERGDPLRVPVLLIGVGDAAELFVRDTQRRREAAFRVVGLLGPGGTRTGGRIHGVPVLGDLGAVQPAIDRLAARGAKPQRLIVTLDSIATEDLRRLLEIADANGMTLARLPRLTELQSSDASVAASQVRPIAIEDLLGRARTVLDRSPMRDLVAGARVLVTGAGGSIGGELARQIASYGPARLALLDHAEFLLYEIDREIRQAQPGLDIGTHLADVRDRARLDHVLAMERPTLVFHAAALKHVPMAELSPAEAALTNVVGTRNLADACRSAGIRIMVLISTDKVVNPASVLGATKRLAESYCQALDIAERERGAPTRYLVVRFGNVLGSTGSVVPLFQQQLAAGGPLTVTHPEVTRFFMTAREAVELVLQAAALGIGDTPPPGALFVLDMGEPVKIADLARQMIRLSGKRPGSDIQIVFTGLRAGEKLSEELFHPREAMTPTDVPGLLLGAPRTADRLLLRNALDELGEAARAGRDEQVRALLHRLVPEYRPSAGTPAPMAAAR